jgi:hypothetical protein
MMLEAVRERSAVEVMLAGLNDLRAHVVQVLLAVDCRANNGDVAGMTMIGVLEYRNDELAVVCQVLRFFRFLDRSPASLAGVLSVQPLELAIGKQML